MATKKALVAKTETAPVKAPVTKLPSEAEISAARAVLQAARANRPATVRYGNTVKAETAIPAVEANLPRQARAILAALRSFKKPVTVNELVLALTAKGGLETRQEPYRIFTFYRKRLLDSKLISLS